MPADYARRNADRLSWVEPSDELLAVLQILNGRDADLAADATRLKDVLLAVSPALEKALGDKAASNTGPRDALARWGTPTPLRAAGKARARARIAKRSPGPRAGSPTRSGPRSARRPSPSPPKRPGATPSQSSPRTWTGSATGAAASPKTSRRRSWRTHGGGLRL